MKNQSIVSNKTLIIATISAVFLSLIIYFIVILPAEFGQDPTGIGQKLGFLTLSESRNSEKTIVDEKILKESINSRKDEVFVVVPAKKGIEYKFNIQKYGRLTFNWQTLNESTIYFDFHGEPEGDTTGFFESYSIATANQSEGTLTVPFTGSHGWYWKNTSDKDINIKLNTSGKYEIIGLK